MAIEAGLREANGGGIGSTHSYPRGVEVTRYEGYVDVKFPDSSQPVRMRVLSKQEVKEQTVMPCIKSKHKPRRRLDFPQSAVKH